MTDALAWIEAHPGLAGYVQATGSTLALVIALLLPALQRRTLERATSLKLRPLLRTIFFGLFDLFPDSESPPNDRCTPNDAQKLLGRQLLAIEQLRTDNLSTKCADLVAALTGSLSRLLDAFDYDFEDEEWVAGREREILDAIVKIGRVAPSTRDPEVIAMICEWREHRQCCFAYEEDEKEYTVAPAGRPVLSAMMTAVWASLRPRARA